jgi:hypothetical protein
MSKILKLAMKISKKYCLFLLFFAFANYSIAQRNTKLTFTPRITQDITLYEECKNSFWVSGIFECDSLKLSCSSNAKIWKDEDGSWAIVPDKNAENILVNAYCKDKLIEENIIFNTKPVTCEDVSIKILQNKINSLNYNSCEFGNYFFSDNNISYKEWKNLLKGYKKQKKADTKVKLPIKLIANREADLMEKFRNDMRFKVDTCIITLYDKHRKIKYQKSYKNDEVYFDLEEFIDRMKPKDVIIFSIPFILRLGYDGKKRMVINKSDYYILKYSCYEKIFEIVK